ncbi:MAG TPA: Wzz/FepE/Etk N-terminal domain-containing protein, partial [Hyphomicrobium sp.]|nr:Wzz/FepE/Etk N-terminal domain-containing protein [Hyphomicrobium sp.]
MGNNVEAMAELKAVTGTHGLAAFWADARLAVVKRAKAVALLPVIAAVIAFGIVSFIPDRYAAVVLVQVDPWQKPASSTGASETAIPHPFEAERLAIAQQIESLTSPALLDNVVKSRRLADDPEFQTRPAIAWMTAPFAKSDAKAVAREALAARLTARRVHNSSLIKLEVWSRDAAKAAKIANTVATQYIEQKLSEASSGGAKAPSAEPTASEKVFASLLNQYGLTSTLTGSRIVENAQNPNAPAGPKRARIVGVAALATLALMLGLAMLLERDTRLRTRKVEQMLACPHMTSLPTVAHDDHVPTSARRARLIIAEPGCRYADAVRAACDALAARSSGDSGRV